MSWSKQQVKAFTRDAIKSNKALWDVVPSARAGIIAHTFAGVVCGQHAETLSTEEVSALWHGMLTEAGLVDDF